MTDPRDSDAWDHEDRAIARALGAESPEGDGFTVDADAVADYEAVLAAMPFEAVAPRAELEDDVIAAALARRPAAATAIEGARARRRRKVAPRWIAIGGAAAAAAAIALVLAIGGTSNGPGMPGGRIAPAAATGSRAQVLAAPDTRQAQLITGTPGKEPVVIGRVALGANGQGFLYNLDRAKLGAARWLWLDTEPGDVRVGRMPYARTIHFVVQGDVRAVRGVFLTTEPVLTPGPLSPSAFFDPTN